MTQSFEGISHFSGRQIVDADQERLETLAEVNIMQLTSEEPRPGEGIFVKGPDGEDVPVLTTPEGRRALKETGTWFQELPEDSANVTQSRLNRIRAFATGFLDNFGLASIGYKKY